MSIDSSTPQQNSWLSPYALLFILYMLGAIGVMAWIGPAKETEPRTVVIDAPWVSPHHVLVRNQSIFGTQVSLTDLRQSYESSGSKEPILTGIKQLNRESMVWVYSYGIAGGIRLIASSEAFDVAYSSFDESRDCTPTIAQVRCVITDKNGALLNTIGRYTGIAVCALLLFGLSSIIVAIVRR